MQIEALAGGRAPVASSSNPSSSSGPKSARQKGGAVASGGYPAEPASGGYPAEPRDASGRPASGACSRFLEDMEREKAIWEQKMLGLRGSASRPGTASEQSRPGSRARSAPHDQLCAGAIIDEATSTSSFRGASGSSTPTDRSDVVTTQRSLQPLEDTLTSQLRTALVEAAVDGNLAGELREAQEAADGITCEADASHGSDSQMAAQFPRRPDSRADSLASEGELSRRPSLATPSRQRWAAERLRRKRERLAAQAGTPCSSAASSRAATPLTLADAVAAAAPSQGEAELA